MSSVQGAITVMKEKKTGNDKNRIEKQKKKKTFGWVSRVRPGKGWTGAKATIQASPRKRGEGGSRETFGIITECQRGKWGGRVEKVAKRKLPHALP